MHIEQRPPLMTPEFHWDAPQARRESAERWNTGWAWPRKEGR